MTLYKMFERQFTTSQFIDLVSFVHSTSVRVNKEPTDLMVEDLSQEDANKYCEKYYANKVHSDNMKSIRYKEDLYYLIDIIDWGNVLE